MTFAHLGDSPNDDGKRLLDGRSLMEFYNDVRGALSADLRSRGLSQDRSEDIIQETFLRLIRHTSNRSSDNNLRAWVFRVARNLSIDQHRSEQRWFRGGEICPYVELGRRVDPAPNPEEMILLSERLTRLQKALSQLTPKQKECLLLRAEGRRYREIAVVLGVSVQRVGELLQHAISLVEGK
jgi:RNA polymerase sigma-70 factor, ECF subfamily